MSLTRGQRQYRPPITQRQAAENMLGVIGFRHFPTGIGEPDARNPVIVNGYHFETKSFLILSRDSASATYALPGQRWWIHLSISSVEPDTVTPVPRRPDVYRGWLDSFFGEFAPRAWFQGPLSLDPSRRELWQFWLALDSDWAPLPPATDFEEKTLRLRPWRPARELESALRAATLEA